jgi:hypothetical protein
VDWVGVERAIALKNSNILIQASYSLLPEGEQEQGWWASVDWQEPHFEEIEVTSYNDRLSVKISPTSIVLEWATPTRMHMEWALSIPGATPTFQEWKAYRFWVRELPRTHIQKITSNFTRVKWMSRFAFRDTDNDDEDGYAILVATDRPTEVQPLLESKFPYQVEEDMDVVPVFYENRDRFNVLANGHFL